MQNFKFKKFVGFLSQVDEFEKPKVELEQYCTPADITAGLFEIIALNDGNIEGKVIGDFCCGTCMYSIAASYFDPAKIVGFELDTDAIEIGQANIEHYELGETVQIIHTDLLKQFEGEGPTEGENLES